MVGLLRLGISTAQQQESFQFVRTCAKMTALRGAMLLLERVACQNSWPRSGRTRNVMGHSHYCLKGARSAVANEWRGQ